MDAGIRTRISKDILSLKKQYTGLKSCHASESSCRRKERAILLL
jgi:hypothetical protein